MRNQQAVKKNNSKNDFALTVILWLSAVLFVSILFVSAMILRTLQRYDFSRNEYTELRKIRLYIISDAEDSEEEPDTLNSRDNELLLINPDYVGWLSIADTKVDYPVVRGSDNQKYLTTSFSGHNNPNGAIFMDYQCVGEYVPHIIIYGHNTKQGEMFGDLKKLMDEEYRTAHAVVTFDFNDQVETYQIFSVRKTDISDPAYKLDFSSPASFAQFLEQCAAPAGAEKIITLSTCVSGLDKNERLLVQGSLMP